MIKFMCKTPPPKKNLNFFTKQIHCEYCKVCGMACPLLVASFEEQTFCSCSNKNTHYITHYIAAVASQSTGLLVVVAVVFVDSRPLCF